MNRIRKDLIHIEDISIHRVFERKNNVERVSVRLHKSIPEGKYDIILIPK